MVYILCSFSSKIIVCSPLESVIYLAIYSLPDDCVRYGFHIVEGNLHLIRKWLLTPTVFLNVFSTWSLLQLTGFTVGCDWCWFFFSSGRYCVWHLPALWELATRMKHLGQCQLYFNVYFDLSTWCLQQCLTVTFWWVAKNNDNSP